MSVPTTASWPGWRSGSRRSDAGAVHFDVRWADGMLKFTGKLEVLPRSSPEVTELAMYDDYINYYGFPRELGVIRRKQLQAAGGDCLLEVIIPRVSSGGSRKRRTMNLAWKTMTLSSGSRSLSFQSCIVR